MYSRNLPPALPSNLNTTMQERLQIEKMVICQCKREKSIYFCNNSDCPNRGAIYCDECADQTEAKHLHAPMKIVKESVLLNYQWLQLKHRVSKTFNEASPKHKEFAPIIKYLEESFFKNATNSKLFDMKSIQKDFDSLKQLQGEINECYKIHIEPRYLTFQVFILMEQSRNCFQYEEVYQKYEYLAHLSENTLWEHYKLILNQDVGSDIPDFSQSNKITLQALQIRSLQTKVSKFQPQDSPNPLMDQQFQKNQKEFNNSLSELEEMKKNNDTDSAEQFSLMSEEIESLKSNIREINKKVEELCLDHKQRSNQDQFSN